MRINKITYGFVSQTFDTTTKKWIGQEFIASGDVVEYENAQNGNEVPSTIGDIENKSFPFDMIQPE